jgi:hypothetical protein
LGYWLRSGEQIEPSATALLPFIFSSLVYGGAEHAVNRRGYTFLHVRHQVRANMLANHAG